MHFLHVKQICTNIWPCLDDVSTLSSLSGLDNTNTFKEMAAKYTSNIEFRDERSEVDAGPTSRYCAWLLQLQPVLISV